MNRTFWLFIIALFVSVTASAQGLTIMAGKTKFGPADDGTYWNEIKRHNIALIDSNWAIRYDTKPQNGWSLGVQYTDFGTSELDAQASSRDAPDVGGYDPHTKTCVGGTCAPEHRYMVKSAADSVAMLLTKHYGNWSFDAGVHYYAVETDVVVFGSCITSGCGTSWSYHKTDIQLGAVVGAAYRHGPWVARFQVWELEGRGPIPGISVGLTSTLMVGYTF